MATYSGSAEVVFADGSEHHMQARLRSTLDGQTKVWGGLLHKPDLVIGDDQLGAVITLTLDDGTVGSALINIGEDTAPGAIQVAGVGPAPF